MLSMRPVLMLAFAVYFRNNPIEINQHINPIQGKMNLMPYQLRSVYTIHLLLKEAPRTFKAATAAQNKQMRVFCHLYELNGRF